MNSEKLRELLNRAVTAGLKKPTVEPNISETELGFRLKRLITTEDTIQNEILQFLINEPSFDIFNNKMFYNGFGGSQVTLNTLMSWLLYSCDTNGVDKTIANLENYLSIEYTPANELLAISGVEIDSPAEISPTIQIVPFSSFPLSEVIRMLDPHRVEAKKVI